MHTSYANAVRVIPTKTFCMKIYRAEVSLNENFRIYSIPLVATNSYMPL